MKRTETDEARQVYFICDTNYPLMKHIQIYTVVDELFYFDQHHLSNEVMQDVQFNPLRMK